MKISPKLKPDETSVEPFGSNAHKYFDKNIRPELSDIIYDELTYHEAYESWLDIVYSCKFYKPYKGATRRLKFSDPSKKFWFESMFGD